MPNSGTKKDKACQAMKRAIISGQFESSNILSIKELAEIFSVEVTPARKAMVILSSEGLIEPIPRNGYPVKSLLVHDMLEIFHLRSILGAEETGLAAERITDDEIELIETNNKLRQELGISPQSDNSTHSYQEGHGLKWGFHLIIAQASGNRRLGEIADKLQNESELELGYGPIIARVDVAAAAAIQQNEITERLRRRDTQGAQEVNGTLSMPRSVL